MSDLFLLIMGVQGSGKGTQAAEIARKYSIPHVSTGDLFRAMQGRTDELAERIRATLAAGKLVDDDITNEVLADRLDQPDAAHGALLDGYPRNHVQAQFLADYLAKRGQKLTAVLLLELDLYNAFKRSFGRVSAKDGRTFNIYSNAQGMTWNFEKDPGGKFPPRLVATLAGTGEELRRREDDANAFGVVERIEKFLSETQPLLPKYEAEGLLRRVNADQSIEAVTSALFAEIEKSK
jgi:adenylate kinase